MDQEELIKGLKKLLNIYGPALVSVWLGYRDSRSVNYWANSGNIPRARRNAVERLIKKDTAKELKLIEREGLAYGV